MSTPTTFISADGATNSTTDLSTNPPVLSQDLLLLQASSQVTEQLRVSPSQPRNSHKNSRQGDLDVAFLNPKQTGTRNSSGQRIYLGEKNSLIPAKQRKDGITSVPGNIAGRGASTGGTEFANPDKPRSGLAIPSPLVQVGGARMGNNANGMMASQGDDRERDQSVSGGITIPITESPNPSPGLSPAQYPRALGTVKAEVKRFKGLVPNKKSKSCIPGGYAYTDADTEHEGDATATSSTDTTEPLPKVSSNPLPRKQDYEISASIIRNPPPHLLRRQVEKITQVLALTAFYGFSINSSTSVPGDFLKYFAGLSRNYRYASTLAFTHLIRLEFPGKRTTHWLRTKRIDEGVADVRAWYWHRVSERKTAIEQVRTSWMERVWRFLVLASVPAGSSQAMDIGPGRLGLWFSGISQHLLADPDLHGQFETAVRFWIRRFYVWVTRNGGGYPLLLEDLRGEIVQKIQPVDEKGNRELWRVETRCGGVYFIVGMTGEVVGWVEADGTVGDGLESVRQRRAKTRMGTTIRTRTGARTIGGAGSLQGNRRNQVNTDNITWQNLREDWREHASALVLSSSSPNETGAPPKRLLESVYRPGSKTISHGIHESVKLPHHRALAERWILAQVEPGGISGKPTLEALHGHARRKQKVVLDLQAKLMVESVRCAGEKWTSSMEGTLAQGLGFVQTPGMGWFVLEETGQVNSQEMVMRVMFHDREFLLTLDLAEYCTRGVRNTRSLGNCARCRRKRNPIEFG